MRAKNIKWDTDGDKELLATLPTEVEIPDEVIDGITDEDEISEEVSDWLSDKYEFCHFGFDLENEKGELI